MSEELKPCPFCGGEAAMRWFQDEQHPDIIFVVDCSARCGANTWTTEDNAIAAWNRREETSRWIPVSERLPENDQTVIGTYYDRENQVSVGEVGFSAFYKTWEFGERGISLDYTVTAWRPLPEPWREDDAER